MNSLRLIARLLSTILVINLILHLVKRPFLPWLYHWLLTCPPRAERCELLWQKSPLIERLVWRILECIENHHVV
ncbi:LANO_0F08702g1_1 [Lachancea nothofagi CBS 11611]|uniref:LANO_0F08702g1_1 n=1 Tax=Lachancea nothofagi CBS 11611 TaxID=1266666 RepID=A0A1G4K9I6_9SACH|nr:LANO_0F08702g1_1 [Lachancea nothofagi CBS 11611]